MACKVLHILPPGYPNPIPIPRMHEITLPPTPGTNTTPLTPQEAMLAYPNVFDGQIRDKLKEELDLCTS